MDRTNFAHWEQLAVLHGTGPDRYYDLDKLVAGGTLMGSEEAAALVRATTGTGVHGLDVLHLQCHIGCDSITLARKGANVTGVDFSPATLQRLRELAGRCGVEIASDSARSTATNVARRIHYPFSTRCSRRNQLHCNPGEEVASSVAARIL